MKKCGIFIVCAPKSNFGGTPKIQFQFCTIWAARCAAQLEIRQKNPNRTLENLRKTLLNSTFFIFCVKKKGGKKCIYFAPNFQNPKEFCCLGSPRGCVGPGKEDPCGNGRVGALPPSAVVVVVVFVPNPDLIPFLHPTISWPDKRIPGIQTSWGHSQKSSFLVIIIIKKKKGKNSKKNRRKTKQQNFLFCLPLSSGCSWMRWMGESMEWGGNNSGKPQKFPTFPWKFQLVLQNLGDPARGWDRNGVF